MSYLGRSVDKISNVEKLDNITFDGSSSYTLQKGGVNFVPTSAAAILLSIDGVVQSGNFSVSASTIDFGTAVAGTSTCNFIIHLGVGLITAPSDGSVTAAKVADDLISGQTALSTEPADTDEFLVSDAGTLKRIDYSLIKGGGITLADQYRLTTSFTGSSQDLTSNLERVDTTGQGFIGSVTESSGIFSFSETGVYLITFNMNFNNTTQADNVTAAIKVTNDNGSNFFTPAEGQNNTMGQGQGQAGSIHTQTLFDVTDVSTHKVKFNAGSLLSGTQVVGNTNTNNTYMTFIRLGDT